MSTCFSKYATFSGRASRSEFWWFYLFTVLITWGAILVDPTQIISGILNIALLIPTLAAGSRRLHDIDRSAWWMLLMITIIGVIVLIVFWAQEGKKESNQHGEAIDLSKE